MVMLPASSMKPAEKAATALAAVVVAANCVLGLVTLLLACTADPNSVQLRLVALLAATTADLTDGTDVDHADDGVSGRIDGVDLVDGDEDGAGGRIDGDEPAAKVQRTAGIAGWTAMAAETEFSSPNYCADTAASDGSSSHSLTI